MFMVSDELIVKPLSPILSISLLSKFNVAISDIKERIVCMGEKEVKGNNPVHTELLPHLHQS